MIFTIGYSNRSQPEFLSELQKRQITQLWDVRSSPWSRNAAFNGPQIERWAENAGIMYRQCGDTFGGRAGISLDAAEYVSLLESLIAHARNEHLAIMCAEGEPAQCHRSWDVGASLLVRWGVVAHSILRDGREEDITTTLRRIIPSRIKPEIREAIAAQPDLYGNI
jgi:uncharacterized protein (DUF488 family)